MDLSFIHNPLVVAGISSMVAKHSVDLAKKLLTVESPLVKKLLPWIAAVIGYGLNGLLAWVGGGDVVAALTVTGPGAGMGSVFYHNVYPEKKPQPQ